MFLLLFYFIFIPLMRVPKKKNKREEEEEVEEELLFAWLDRLYCPRFPLSLTPRSDSTLYLLQALLHNVCTLSRFPSSFFFFFLFFFSFFFLCVLARIFPGEKISLSLSTLAVINFVMSLRILAHQPTRGWADTGLDWTGPVLSR